MSLCRPRSFDISDETSPRCRVDETAGRIVIDIAIKTTNAFVAHFTIYVLDEIQYPVHQIRRRGQRKLDHERRFRHDIPSDAHLRVEPRGIAQALKRVSSNVRLGGGPYAPLSRPRPTQPQLEMLRFRDVTSHPARATLLPQYRHQRPLLVLTGSALARPELVRCYEGYASFTALNISRRFEWRNFP